MTLEHEKEHAVPSRTVRSRARRLLLLLCVNCAVLFAALAVVELGLRLFAPQVLRRDPIGFNEPFGAFYRPKANMEIQVAQPEDVTTWKTNSHGLRDKELEYAKRTGTYRILGLGDSFTFGYMVEGNESFLHLLENKLNEDAALNTGVTVERFETINMGVGGYGPVAELNMLRQEGTRYDPDLVLLMLFVGNDIADATRELRLQEHPEEGPSQPTGTFSIRVRKLLGENLHSYSFLSVRLHQLLVKWGLRRINESTVDILRLEPPEDIQRGWAIVEETIIAMHEISIGLAAEFRVVAIPLRHQVQQSEWQTLCQVYNLNSSEYSLEQPQSYLQEMLAAKGIGFIDLLSVFREQEEHLYNQHEDAHLNQQGHIVTATVLQQEIRSLLLEAQQVGR